MIGSLISATAHAGPQSGQWYYSVTGGIESTLSGDALNASSGTVPNLMALNPFLPDTSATVTTNSQSFEDLYDQGLLINAEIGYGLSTNLEVYAMASFNLQNGDQRVIGATTPASTGVSSDVIADFGDLETWRFQVGGRYYFNTGSRFQPFVSARAGLASIDAVDAIVVADYSALLEGIDDAGAQVPFFNVPLYEDSTVFTGGVEAGLAVTVTDDIEVKLSVAAQYTASLDRAAASVDPLAIRNIAEKDSRWTLPLSAGLTYRF
ncbi:MAG: hypothetical protein Tsb002_34630 [Wenzhouxiangellaceae bacterium]